MDKEILVNPYTAIRHFARTFLAFGGSVLTDRKYKVTREAWIASMFLIARGNLTKTLWWFAPVIADGSPDFNCYSFSRDISDKFNLRSKLKLEVFEWRKEQSESDFIEAIKTIKLNKIVNPEITLVCYIRRTGVVPAAVSLNQRIKALNPHVKDLWYLGDVSDDGSIWRVTEVYPNTSATDLNYDQILTTRESHSFLYGYLGKTDMIEFEPTGKQVQLTPEFELKEDP